MNALLKEIKKNLNLSAQLSMVLEKLVLQDIVTKDDLFQAIVDFNPRINHSESAARMAIYRLRSALMKNGFHIQSRYGEGYYLAPSDKALLKPLIYGEAEDQV